MEEELAQELVESLARQAETVRPASVNATTQAVNAPHVISSDPSDQANIQIKDNNTVSEENGLEVYFSSFNPYS